MPELTKGSSRIITLKVHARTLGIRRRNIRTLALEFREQVGDLGFQDSGNVWASGFGEFGGVFDRV